MKKAFLVLLCSILLCSMLSIVSYAFQVTPDLAKEIREKESAVKAKPNDPWAHFDLAITYAYTNKIEAGWDQLKKVHDLATPVYGSDEKYAKVIIPKINTLLSADQKDWKARFRLAFAMFFGGDKQGAINELDVISQQYPDNIWAYGYKGVIYGEKGDFDKAIVVLKKALKLDGDVSSLHYAMGQALLKKGLTWNGTQEIAVALKLKAMGK
jgi:tetratricopeptide (TPR) repeat protein